MGGYRVYLPGVKWPGRGVDYPPPSSADVRERVEFTSTSPLGLNGLFWGEIYLFYVMRSERLVNQVIGYSLRVT
jgi:hypothetical protein